MNTPLIINETQWYFITLITILIGLAGFMWLRTPKNKKND